MSVYDIITCQELTSEGGDPAAVVQDPSRARSVRCDAAKANLPMGRRGPGDGRAGRRGVRVRPRHARCDQPADHRVEPAGPAYADTTWPTEHADVWRTHAVTGGPAIDGPGTELVATSVPLAPVPVWGYTGTGAEVYVIGGAPYLLDMFTEVILGAPSDRIPALTLKSRRYAETVTPYVAKVDPATMEAQVLELTEGSSANYTGGLLVHANGSLYAVARSTLYEIDPATFTIVASQALPLAPKATGEPNPQTAYNGMVATSDGDLVLKGWASTGGGEDAPGLLLRIDPDDLSTTAQLETTVITSARMAVVDVDGVEHLYMPGKAQSLRFRIDPTAFVLDEAFSQTYLTDETGQSQASSDVVMGDSLVFADNTSPTATTPMRLFTQPTAGSDPTLHDRPVFPGDEPSWNFFMVAADPYESGTVVVGDQRSGQVAGFRACAGGTALEPLWVNDALAATAGVAIDHEQGVVWTDDRRCSGGDCQLFAVALDLDTGEELARVEVAGTKPSIGQIFIGGDGAVYYPATETREAQGHLTRVTAR